LDIIYNLLLENNIKGATTITFHWGEGFAGELCEVSQAMSFLSERLVRR
jgi:hypothetical protein